MTTKLIKVNKGSSLIEITAALAVLVSVTYFVTLQDTSSLAQAQRDARLAMATLWLENEVALVRSSLPPWATNQAGATSHLQLYPDTAGTNIYENVPLVGEIGARLARRGEIDVGDYASRFSNCVVRRVLVDSSTGGYDDLMSFTYRVDVVLPQTLVVNGNRETETVSRTVHRTFAGGGL
jgi:hypothetical protein